MAGTARLSSRGATNKAANGPVAVRADVIGVTTITSDITDSPLAQRSLRLADAIIIAAVTIGVAGARIGGGNAALVFRRIPPARALAPVALIR